MKGELADECSYTREASYLTRFGSSSFLGGDDRFKIPWVWEGSTDSVLVMQYVDGVSVGEGAVGNLSQADRDVVSGSAFMLLQGPKLKKGLDSQPYHRALPERAIRVQSNANRP